MTILFEKKVRCKIKKKIYLLSLLFKTVTNDNFVASTSLLFWRYHNKQQHITSQEARRRGTSHPKCAFHWKRDRDKTTCNSFTCRGKRLLYPYASPFYIQLYIVDDNAYFSLMVQIVWRSEWERKIKRFVRECERCRERYRRDAAG